MLSSRGKGTIIFLSWVAALGVLITSLYVNHRNQPETRPFTPYTLEDFSAVPVSGPAFSSHQWRGSLVIVNFWATWCAPCVAEMPALGSVGNRFAPHIQVVGVSIDSDEVDLSPFLAKHDIVYSVIRQGPAIAKVFGNISTVPTTFVVGPHGEIVLRHTGALPEHLIRLIGLAYLYRFRSSVAESLDSVYISDALTSIPGLDLGPVAKHDWWRVLLSIGAARCDCGCGLSLTECRLYDQSCNRSLEIASTRVGSR
jgi:thiol-disulfide isomerase/thioredoxin